MKQANPLIKGQYTIKKILTEDWICRKRRSWPLVTLGEFKNYRILSRSDSTESEVFSVPSNWKKPMLIGPVNVYAKFLYETFPCLQTLLKKYSGKIALCGGSIARAIQMCRSEHPSERLDSDADIFFYGVTVSEAETILHDCVGILASNRPNSKIKKEEEYETIVQKNDNVINVTHFYHEEVPHRPGRTEIKTIKYQFILRIYPTLDSILGGFDLGCSMVAFDGNEIYATPLGAWSTINSSVIVDTTRRSTSFEHRLIKYKYAGFNIIFPGLNDSVKRLPTSKDKSWQEEEKEIRKIKQEMLDRGLRIEYRDGYYDYGQESDFPMQLHRQKPIHLGVGLSLSINVYDGKRIHVSLDMVKKWLPEEWRFGREYSDQNSEDEEKTHENSSQTKPVLTNRSHMTVSLSNILKRYSDYHNFIFYPLKEKKTNVSV